MTENNRRGGPGESDGGAQGRSSRSGLPCAPYQLVPPINYSHHDEEHAERILEEFCAEVRCLTEALMMRLPAGWGVEID